MTSIRTDPDDAPETATAADHAQTFVDWTRVNARALSIGAALVLGDAARARQVLPSMSTDSWAQSKATEAIVSLDEMTAQITKPEPRRERESRYARGRPWDNAVGRIHVPRGKAQR